MPFSVLASIGLANPPHKVAQSDIFSFMAAAHGLSILEKSRLKKIYDGSGIQYRYSVLDDYGKVPGNFSFYGNGEGLEPFPSTRDRARVFESRAADIGFEAVKDCFSKITDFSPSSITHLITVTCTGLHAPGLDIELVDKIGLNPETERVSINFMGCYAAFNALKTADYICRSEPQSQVLIVNVELCTLHFQKENTLTNWLSNALFADGASAALVHSNENPVKSHYPFKMRGFYSKLILDAKKEMAWNLGNFGFEMQLSSHIAKRIQSSIKDVAVQVLKKVNLNFSDLAQFAIHPGGRRILEVCEEILGFEGGSDHPSYSVLREFGNMSSATIFFVLKEMGDKFFRKEYKSGPLLSFAFGPGLTFESMVLEPLA